MIVPYLSAPPGGLRTSYRTLSQTSDLVVGHVIHVCCVLQGGLVGLVDYPDDDDDDDEDDEDEDAGSKEDSLPPSKKSKLNS